MKHRRTREATNGLCLVQLPATDRWGRLTGFFGAILGAILVCENGSSIARDSHFDAVPRSARPEVALNWAGGLSEGLHRSSATQFGSGDRGSRELAAEGWSHLKAGRITAALEAFHRARLLNEKNYEAYWGLGAVLSEQGKWLEAIEQLETAREFIDDQKQLAPLLTDIGAVRTTYAASLSFERELERAQQFSAANQRFAASLEIDPEYAPSWRQWAISLYQQQRYSEAWIKAARALELKAEPFPADFLRKLKRKIAESN